MLWSAKAGMFRHGYTYSGHPVCAQAALTNLDIVERDQLLAAVQKLTPVLAMHLDRLAAHPAVAATRHAGLLGAVELHPDVEPERPVALERTVANLRARGVLTRGLVGHSLQISPPFVITESELAILFHALTEELDSLGPGGQLKVANV